MSTQRTPTLLDLVGLSAATGKERTATEERLDWIAVGVELVLRLTLATASGYVMLWMTKKFFAPMLPEDSEARPVATVYQRLQAILERRGQSYRRIPELTRHELQIAEEVLDPDDIESEFADVGGLDQTKREIYELAILPLVKPELFRGKLVQPCKGILLYGKPGTGKTMLAKALAKESKSVFLPLQLSKILNKWVGESNKLVAATFSLAHKLQPAIIFIDELDTFLKANTSETAYLDSIKAEFLTLWDGIATASTSRVLVLGATNKPHTVDSAILRRMPRSFHVPLPDRKGRFAILSLLLEEENIDEEAREFLPHLAGATAGYSGSDLKELCKAAAMVGIQEQTAEYSKQCVMGRKSNFSTTDTADSLALVPKQKDKPLRPISRKDLLVGLDKVKMTGAAAKSYGQREKVQQEREEASYTNRTIDLNLLQNLSLLAQALSGGSDDGDNSNNREDEEDEESENDDDDDKIPEI